MKRLRPLILAAFALTLASCTGVPEGVTPVQDFRLQPYLGRWYEIARLDHSFERGLTRVTADYSLNPDGSVRVINRGYDAREGEWQQAEGRAVFAGDENSGHLKVSFFGPFYASYVIIELDSDYRYALVSGYNREYLWILSRSPQLAPETRERLVRRAAELGFPTGQLIFVEQSGAAAGDL
ncbi:lipocalin family protein [Microbulbifer litoralis]|uniref:lipocalin family protein n=1 Tax=Microbulbifer litoralis TaxID=2933965 RepID=UPI00202802EA